MITIKIDNIDRSSLIDFGSVKKKDNINQDADTLQFSLEYHAGQTFRPEVSSLVEMLDGDTRIFYGRITSIDQSIESDSIVSYDIRCNDIGRDLTRYLANETYEKMSVNDIITALLEDFSDGTFTTNNVNCDIEITKITYDRVNTWDAINQLADLTNYSWYVDYDKDIHFFPKNNEPAPINISDDSDNFIFESLKISNDITQIKNRVMIKGGEVEGDPRTEYFDGNGTRDTFVTANKFARLPTVLVDGVEQAVGIDYLSSEEDFDCFWDYNQKYIRFKEDTIPPAGTNNISVTGIPLYNIIIQMEEPTSIANYGVAEFYKNVPDIKSREDAILYAKAQIEAYRAGIDEGEFQTYTSGLRSGQIISISSTLMGISEQFVIQSVDFSMLTQEKFKYQVKLASVKSIGIIDFLINLLKNNKLALEKGGESVIEKTTYPIEKMAMSDAIAIDTDDYPQSEEMIIAETITERLNYQHDFVLCPYEPTDIDDVKREFLLDCSPLC